MLKIIIGTRAELIKIFPVILELEKKDIDFEFIATGQHNLNDLCDKLEIRRPDIYLSDPRDGFVLNTKEALKFFKENIIKIKRIINKEDLVIVHGDTLSTVIGSIGSKIKGAKVAHIEAGLRSWDIFEPFPEEIARTIADFSSTILFAVSKLTYRNLKKEFPWKKEIYLVGNTIVDSATIASNMLKDIEIPSEDYGVVSVHRHENLKNVVRLTKIVKILREVANFVKLYVFLYKNTEIALKKYNLYKCIKKHPNIIIKKPIDYFKFIKWIQNAKILLTDGGSIQEESIIFGIPCILLRMKTERIEGLQTGLNYLSKLKVKDTIKKSKEFLEGKFPKNVRNPYGSFGVSREIVCILREKL